MIINLSKAFDRRRKMIKNTLNPLIGLAVAFFSGLLAGNTLIPSASQSNKDFSTYQAQGFQQAHGLARLEQLGETKENIQNNADFKEYSLEHSLKSLNNESDRLKLKFGSGLMEDAFSQYSDKLFVSTSIDNHQSKINIVLQQKDYSNIDQVLLSEMIDNLDNYLEEVVMVDYEIVLNN